MRNFRNVFFALMFSFVGSSVFGNCCFRDQAMVPVNSFFKDEELVDQLKKNKMKIFVFRHHESINNSQDVVISSRSPGYFITEKGLQNLKDTAQKFTSKGIEAIYTSPLYSSLQATHLMGNILQLPPEKLMLKNRLVIQNFGTYEGRSYEDYKNLFCSFEHMLEGNAPGGEPGQHVFQRSREFLWRIANGPEKTILVLTHAFNLCHIHMCLTGEFGNLPVVGEYVVYDFSQPE